MAKGRAVRERLDVLALAREPASPRVEGALVDYLKDCDPRHSPVSALLERGSDWTFVDAIVGEVQTYGLEAGEAEAVTAGVLGSPSLVMVSRTRSPDLVEVLMAVALDSAPSGVNVAVAGFVVEPGKPPRVDGYSIELDSVDLDPPDGIAEIALRFEVDQRRMGVPRITTRPLGEVRQVVWIGNPLHLGYFDAPHSWIEEVRSAGIVHAIDIEIVQTVSESRAKDLVDGADRVLLLPGIDPEKWNIPKDSDKTFEFGRAASGFPTLLADLRLALVQVREDAEVIPDTQRTLAQGERVFHRKVGDNPRYDKFDEGSAEGCIHEADGYIRFHKAPKALKGMQRRYTNIGPQDLYHCGKYPSCGMYMVEGPS